MNCHSWAAEASSASLDSRNLPACICSLANRHWGLWRPLVWRQGTAASPAEQHEQSFSRFPLQCLYSASPARTQNLHQLLTLTTNLSLKLLQLCAKCWILTVMSYFESVVWCITIWFSFYFILIISVVSSSVRTNSGRLLWAVYG